MSGRLILAIVSTILEEIAIVVVARWGLPQLDIFIPLWGLILIMVAWASYSIFTFRMGTRALNREHIIGLPHMIGSRGRVERPLLPEGLVRIHGELWVAKGAEGKSIEGGNVIVVDQDRLKLIVKAQ